MFKPLNENRTKSCEIPLFHRTIERRILMATIEELRALNNTTSFPPLPDPLYLLVKPSLLPPATLSSVHLMASK